MKDKSLFENNLHHSIWLMVQLIIFFIDNPEFANKFDKFKPINAFLILYYLFDNNVSLKIKFIGETHDYLAK